MAGLEKRGDGAVSFEQKQAAEGRDLAGGGTAGRHLGAMKDQRECLWAGEGSLSGGRRCPSRRWNDVQERPRDERPRVGGVRSDSALSECVLRALRSWKREQGVT